MDLCDWFQSFYSGLRLTSVGGFVESLSKDNSIDNIS